jgi:DNA modification methylase
MILPINIGQTWKANRHLAANPYASVFEFSDDNHIHLEDWELSYTAKGESLMLNNKTVNDVLTIQGPDISVNATITDPASFGSRTFLQDKYAKNIGLVYQEYILWEYQPNPGSSAFRVGFGVKRSMIDHN